MSDHDYIVASDHTAIRDRPKRMWSFMEFSLPGISMPGISAAGGVFVVIAIIGTIAAGVTGLRVLFYVLAVLGLLVAIGVYFAWGKPLADKMSMLSALVIWADWTFVQPRTIHGFTHDQEPQDVQWQLILWHPTDPGWWAAYNHTLDWLRTHGHQRPQSANA